MDGIYRYQRYIYDVTRKYFLLGRDTLLEAMDPPAGGTILEVGCGTGRNLIKAARRNPNTKVYGFDISTMMLETARANIESAGLSDRITVVEGDATNFSTEELFGEQGIDRVFISYSLSMIPPWREAITQGLEAVKPGGSLHIVDFGQQERLPGLFKKGLSAWLAKFSVEPRPDLEQELQAQADKTGCKLKFERILRDYAQHAIVSKPAV
ncbi:MAG: class I SAM-dependent methyltransferase [Alphaproteobacteria bacterium]|nr:class I SAM-dependent methyltransferase [Alphaproteobacteria bacterium]